MPALSKATKQKIMLSVGVLAGVLSATAFIALALMFPPAAALGFGAILMYVTTTISVTGLLTYLIDHAIKTYYDPQPDPYSRNRFMARDEAASSKTQLRQTVAFLAVLAIPTALFVFFMTAPFAITIMTAIVTTGLSIGGVTGVITSSIANCCLSSREKENSASAASSFKGSTGLSQNVLNIDGTTTSINNAATQRSTVSTQSQSASSSVSGNESGKAANLDNSVKSSRPR